MFRNIIQRQLCRSFGSSSMKVAILGAAGKTGTSLSLFLKQSPLIEELSLYDVRSLHGIDTELNSIDTACKVTSYSSGESALKCALENAKIVIITAAKSSSSCESKVQPTSFRNLDNATLLKDLICGTINYCPQALIAIATNPINSLIPMAVEMYKKAGILKHNQIFGLTSLSCMKANVFLADYLRIGPEYVTVPVIGGHCRNSCVPVFSQAIPQAELNHDDYDKLICIMKRTFDNCENSPSNPTTGLAMGFVTSRFCISLCKALLDHSGVCEYAYVKTNAVPGIEYFAVPIELGPCGIMKHLSLPKLNLREDHLLRTSISTLKKAIVVGEKLALGKFEKTYECPQKPTVSCEN